MGKLFVCDFDGTLYRKNNDRGFRAACAEIRRLKSSGSEVIVATGRPLHLIESFFDNFESSYFITNDGALFTKGFDIIFENAIDKTKLQEITEKNRMDFVAYGQCISYTNVKNISLRLELDRIYGGHVLNVDGIGSIEENIYKVFFAGNTAEADFLDRCWNGCGAEEFTAAGVNKGKALAFAQKFLGYSKSDTVAIGDGAGDTAMFEHAAASYAMADAPLSVKAKAKHIISDVTDVLRGDRK